MSTVPAIYIALHLTEVIASTQVSIRICSCTTLVQKRPYPQYMKFLLCMICYDPIPNCCRHNSDCSSCMCHSPACSGDHRCCHSDSSGSVSQKAVKVQVCAIPHNHSVHMTSAVVGLLFMYCTVHCGGVLLSSAVFTACCAGPTVPSPTRCTSMST